MSYGGQVIAGMVQGATWGTPVEVTKPFLILSENLTEQIEQLRDESAGLAHVQDQVQGLRSVEGQITCYLRYESVGLLIALAMGEAAASLAGASSAYLHDLTLANTLSGIFGTLAIYKGYSTFEFPSIKVTGFRIESRAGERVRAIFNVIADCRNINTTSGTNTNSVMAALGAPERGKAVLHRQGAFWINSQSGAALASGDAIQPNEMVFEYQRPIERNYTTSQDTDEPTENGLPTCSLRFGFPEYAADTYLSAFIAGSQYKAQIKYSGVEIESGYNQEFTIRCAALMPKAPDEPSVDGGAKLVHAIEFDVLGVASAPSGMTGLTDPFEVEIQNTETSALLS